ncbi:glycosyltransferase, partial [Candidatus Microgenomates bacterium]|nr:glycosyltransferase [Candidatus Microgenomates bacterium]
PNVSYDELVSLYETSMFYWHFTGLGVNEREHPERVEHLGITPLEAMAARAVVCCFAAGGPRELIEQGKNGFLFTSEDELISIMKSIKPEQIKEIAQYGSSYARAHFSYQVFKNSLLKIINT